MDLFQSINNFNGNMIDPWHINNIIDSMSIFTSTIILIISLVHCFYGYKLLKWWTSFIGFIMFGLIGYGISYGIKGDASTSLLCGLIIGLIGALISFSLYKTGIVLIAFGTGLFVGYLICESVQTAAVLGVICGVLVLLFMKPVLILTIAVSSGILAGRNLAMVLDLSSDMGAVLSMLFAIFGTLYQWKENIGGIRFGGLRRKNRRRDIRDRKPYDLSIQGIKDVFTKLKNKIRFDDDNNYEDGQYDYDKTEFMPLNNDSSDVDKTIFMPAAEENADDADTTKLFQKINERTKEELNTFNNSKIRREAKQDKQHNDLKTELGVRCPRCSNLCGRYDKYCHNCGEKLLS